MATMNYPGVENPKKATYSPAKTAGKGGKEFAAGSVAGLIAMWLAARIWGTDIEPEQLALYTGILVGPVSGALMVLRNIVREITRRYGFDFLNILPMALLLVAVGVAGCASTAKTRHFETHWEEGSNGELQEVTVEISAKTKAGIFGKVPEGVHDVSASWSEKLDTVRLGQSAILDNTAQVQALDTAMPFVQAILQGAFAALTTLQAPPADAQAGFSADQAQELNRLFQAIGGRLDLLGADVKALKAPSTE